jgi:uncharacterized OB-fold protein
MAEVEALTAPLVIEYPFTRTTGPVVGAFLTALREGFVVGIRGEDGRVIVPPQEYDPVTSAELTEVVEVGTEGEVLTWCWTPDPIDGNPLDRPFAWVLVRLDGADTGFLHALDVASPDEVRTGMRVRLRFRPAEERVGDIRDIACFEPADGGEGEG